MDKISLLTVAVTYRCNSGCRHCQIPTPPSSGCVDPTLFKRLLKSLVNKGLKQVCLWGGEPLLEREVVFELLLTCKDLGVKSIVITNGFWGKDKGIADEIAAGLAKNGLDSLHISADPFHQECIPLESVKQALISSVDAGIPEVEWVGKYPGGMESENPFNEKMRKIEDEMGKIPGVKKSMFSSPLQVVGRTAVDPEIHRFISFSDEAPAKCPVIPPISRLGIDPDGNLICCDGTVLTSVENYLSNGFDPMENPIVKTIIEAGPKGLAELAGMTDINDRLFAGPCNLCWEARNRLRAEYPKILAPECFYV